MEDITNEETGIVCEMFEKMNITRNQKLSEFNVQNIYAKFVEEVLKTWK